MIHPGLTPNVQRRRRFMLFALRAARWNRATAADRVRELAAVALEGAAVALRARQDHRVRAGVERAMRRMAVVTDLEAAP